MSFILRVIYGFLIGMMIIQGSVIGVLVVGFVGAIIIAWSESLAKTKTNVRLEKPSGVSKTSTTSTSQELYTGGASPKASGNWTIINGVYVAESTTSDTPQKNHQ